MKKIFITGDRSMDPVVAAGAVEAILKDLVVQNQGELAVATGNLAGGVERAVRYLLPEGDVNVFHYEETDEGYIDFDEMFAELADESDEVVFVHMDPQSSRIGKSIFAHVSSEKIRLPFQEAMSSLL
jgi:hypothetical protein